MQMVIAPNDLFSWNNRYNKYSVINIFTHFLLSYARELTLCMLASWSHEGVVFLDFLPSPRFVTSFLFPCLDSTDTPCPRLGDPVPPLPKWRPYSQGPCTLPYRDPEQLISQKKRQYSVFIENHQMRIWKTYLGRKTLPKKLVSGAILRRLLAPFPSPSPPP
jgi:hypothetical protein